MKTRLIIGPLLIAALVALIVLDSHLERPYAFLGIVSLAAVACSLEVSAMLRERRQLVDYLALLLTGLALLAHIFFGDFSDITDYMSAITLNLAFLVVALGTCNVWNKEVKDFLPQLSGTLATYCYVFVPIAMILIIRLQPGYGEWIVYWLIAVCKLCDSAAYFTGKAFGKTKQNFKPYGKKTNPFNPKTIPTRRIALIYGKNEFLKYSNKHP